MNSQLTKQERVEEAVAFLKFLHRDADPDTYFSMTTFPEGKPNRVQIFRVGEELKAAREWIDIPDTYTSIGTLHGADIASQYGKPSSSIRGKKAHVHSIGVVWAEIDPPKESKVTKGQREGGYEDLQQEYLDRLASFSIPPSWINLSGRGVHAFWNIDRTGEQSVVEEINRGLKLELQSDDVQDVSRVLRVPGTLHSKTGTHMTTCDASNAAAVYSTTLFKRVPDGIRSAEQKTPPVQEAVDTSTTVSEELEAFLHATASPQLRQALWGASGDIPGGRKDGGAVDRSGRQWFVINELLRLGISRDAIYAVLTHPTWPIGERYREDHNQQSILYSIEKAVAKRAEPTEEVDQKQKRLDEIQELNLTELGNAKRFLAYTDGQVRWSSELKSWLVWNGSWWELDETNQTKKMMIEMVLQMNKEALLFEDAQKRALQQQWALRSETDRIINASLSLSQPFVSIVMKDFDTNPDLIALRGATIDLRTGEVRVPDPNDNITRGLDFTYDSSKECPKFDQFLSDMFNGEDDLIEFTRRLIGYSLTGYSNEKVMIFCHGPKDAGKTILVETLAKMFGVYAAKLPATLFTTGLRGSGEYDLIKLRGARYAFATEVEDGDKLAQARVKEITGGDSIRGRNPYGRPIHFQPTHTIWLATNHKPKIRGGDEATWRRILMLPALHTVPEAQQNKRLLDELEQELPGIFNWALVGAGRWYARGLTSPPEKVVEAKKEYREENELVTKFLQDQVIEEKGAYVAISDMYTTYRSWCIREHNEPLDDILSANAFGREMTARGYERKQIAKINKGAYLNVQLRSREEPRQGTIVRLDTA